MITKVTINNKVDYYSIDYLSHSKLTQIEANPDWMLYPDHLTEELSYEFLGTMIHSYILEPDKFNKIYAVFDGNMPSSKQQIGYANLVASGRSPEDAYEAMYKTEGVSTNAIEKAVKKLNFELNAFIQIKKDKPNAVLVKDSQMKMLEEMKNSLIQNKHTNKILFELDGLNEQNFFGYYKKERTKAKVDRIAFDKENKIIYVADLKSMSVSNKKTHLYEEILRRMQDYNYYRQLTYYSLFVRNYYKEKIKDGWEIKAVIIFATTDIPFAVRIYNIWNGILEFKANIIEGLLKDAILHKELGYKNGIEYYKSSEIPNI